MVPQIEYRLGDPKDELDCIIPYESTSVEDQIEALVLNLACEREKNARQRGFRSGIVG